MSDVYWQLSIAMKLSTINRGSHEIKKNKLDHGLAFCPAASTGQTEFVWWLNTSTASPDQADQHVLFGANVQKYRDTLTLNSK